MVSGVRSSCEALATKRRSHNDLARRFALRAIAAQPLDYLREVAHDAALAFRVHPRAAPGARVPGAVVPRRLLAAALLPAHRDRARRTRPRHPRHVVGRPYASFLGAYRYPGLLHGPLFGVALLLGGIGAIGRRRAALLPLAAAVYLFLGPIAVPVACAAAALGVRDLAAIGLRLRRAAV